MSINILSSLIGHTTISLVVYISNWFKVYTLKLLKYWVDIKRKGQIQHEKVIAPMENDGIYSPILAITYRSQGWIIAVIYVLDIISFPWSNQSVVVKSVLAKSNMIIIFTMGPQRFKASSSLCVDANCYRRCPINTMRLTQIDWTFASYISGAISLKKVFSSE